MRIRAWAILSATLLPASALAAGTGGEYAPIIAGSIHFYSGDTGKSLTGASAYVLTFQAEKRKGMLRPSVGAELSMASGEASVGEAEPQFSLWGSGFHGGVNLFIFPSGRFQPYVGGHGIVSWNLLKLPSPPEGVEPNTQGLAFGYTLTAGADLRLGSAEGRAIRIESSFWQTTSSLAGVSGFMLSGFRLTFGVVF